MPNLIVRFEISVECDEQRWNAITTSGAKITCEVITETANPGEANRSQVKQV